MLNNTRIILIVILSIFSFVQNVLNQDIQDIQNQNILPPPPVPQWCIGCMCEVLSGCKENSLVCEGEVCGPFKITNMYWLDVGKPPTQEGVETKFEDCANDVFCSAKAVQRYMAKYKTDCDGDGKIDCNDFLLIHFNGPLNCKNKTLTDAQESNYIDCKQKIESTDFDKNAKPK